MSVEERKEIRSALRDLELQLNSLFRKERELEEKSEYEVSRKDKDELESVRKQLTVAEGQIANCSAGIQDGVSS